MPIGRRLSKARAACADGRRAARPGRAALKANRWRRSCMARGLSYRHALDLLDSLRRDVTSGATPIGAGSWTTAATLGPVVPKTVLDVGHVESSTLWPANDSLCQRAGSDQATFRIALTKKKKQSSTPCHPNVLIPLDASNATEGRRVPSLRSRLRLALRRHRATCPAHTSNAARTITAPSRRHHRPPPATEVASSRPWPRASRPASRGRDPLSDRLPSPSGGGDRLALRGGLASLPVRIVRLGLTSSPGLGRQAGLRRTRPLPIRRAASRRRFPAAPSMRDACHAEAGAGGPCSPSTFSGRTVDDNRPTNGTRPRAAGPGLAPVARRP